MNTRSVKLKKKARAAFSAYGGVAMAVTFMIIVLSLISDKFFLPINIQNLLKQLTTNALLGYALTLVLISGEIDLTVGSGLAFTGCCFVLFLRMGIPFFIAMGICLAIGACIGTMNGFIITRTGMPAFIVTLGMQNVIRGFAYILCGSEVRIKTTNEFFYSFGNMRFFGIPIQTYVIVVVAAILILILNCTRFGKHLYATGGNKHAALYSGINVNKVKTMAFIMSGVITALAGCITSARVNSGQPTIGQGFEGDAIAAAVLGGTSFNGGKGTIIGTIIGAVVIGVISNGLNLLNVNYNWQLVAKGAIIVVAVYFDTWKRSREK